MRVLPIIDEVSYPLTFHKREAAALGEHIRHRHNVVMLGMKRVGISNFLRFFLNHKDIQKEYIKDEKTHLFIAIDLNDLVERELIFFWKLTEKRIADTVEKSTLAQEIKQEIKEVFASSSQSMDKFIAIEAVRKSLLVLIENQITPTLFFILFDRLKEVATPEFFSNIQGLLDATNKKASCVFTSYRPLDVVAPNAFPRSSLVVFSHDMYIKPVLLEDAHIIADTYKKRYGLVLPLEAEECLYAMVDGYVRYLHLALVILNERKEKELLTKKEVGELLEKDERIMLQSEELWESLTGVEQEIIIKIHARKSLSIFDEEQASYLVSTGFIEKKGEQYTIFSPLFEYFLKSKGKEMIENSSLDFTKKEQLLFGVLKGKINDVCEREDIISAVWPEVEAFGVSDWAVDRLVARVRHKLKLQKSMFEIQTIKTRGYKLVGDRE